MWYAVRRTAKSISRSSIGVHDSAWTSLILGLGHLPEIINEMVYSLGENIDLPNPTLLSILI